jgi:hypothetical protein
LSRLDHLYIFIKQYPAVDNSAQSLTYAPLIDTLAVVTDFETNTDTIESTSEAPTLSAKSLLVVD